VTGSVAAPRGASALMEICRANLGPEPLAAAISKILNSKFYDNFLLYPLKSAKIHLVALRKTSARVKVLQKLIKNYLPKEN